MGDGEELSSVGSRKPNMGHWEGRQVMGTEGYVFCLWSQWSISRAMMVANNRRKRILTAQQPSTTRLFQGLRGFAETESMVSAIKRITSSASSSS